MKNYKIEICAAHIQSAIAAQEGGASRIELCDNLYEGGTTPSYATIKLARAKLNIGLNVMIRPRGSDFCYSDDEFDIMKEDIAACKELGADGVVFGILLPNGNVDIERTRQLVEIARPLSVTFHRAFDMTPDPFRALEEIIRAGIDRILTAGQANTVPEGLNLIIQLAEKAGDRIIIMPGSGINEQNIREIRDKTGASEFHLSGRKPVQSRMTFRKEGIFMGGLREIPEFEMQMTDAGRVREMVKLVNG
ncbi:MAG: copper homeostasis protein CutC [Bacteroidetes bacterium]|nr:copper homeostasis protein CutC [Bacteroidota bacterium]